MATLIRNQQIERGDLRSFAYEQVEEIVSWLKLGYADRPNNNMTHFIHIRLAGGREWEGYCSTTAWDDIKSAERRYLAKTLGKAIISSAVELVSQDGE